MAKRTKPPRGRQPTKRDNRRTLGPTRIGPPPNVDAAAQLERERLEFETRRRAQLAKTAIELDPTDIRILEHQVLRPWLTQEQIGDLVGLGRQAVNERINAPKFQRALEESAKSALQIFEQNKARAARKLGALLESPDDRVAIRSAIAHMWPHIHADGAHAGDDDFVKLLQEAAAEAEADAAAKIANAAAAPTTATGTDGGGVPTK